MPLIRFFDVFAGIGGFRSGLEKAGGFECVGYCEIDKYAKAAYEAIYDTRGEVYYEDIRKIDSEKLPDFECLCGGFPCQSFSIAGKRRGFDDTRGTMFFEIARIAAVKKPKYMLLENVPGLLNHDGGRTFKTILDALDDLGYDVTWQVLNSADHYVAQARKRVFIVCFLREKCSGRVLSYREANPKTLVKRIPGREGERVYDPEGLGITLNANAGGFAGRTGLYLFTEDAALPIKSLTKSGYQLAYPGDSIDLAYPDMNSRRGRVGDNIAHTVTPSATQGYYDVKCIDMNYGAEITELARCIPARQDGGVGHHKGERSGVLELTAPIPILTPEKEQVRQQGRRMKDPDDPMFTITVTDRHGVVYNGAIRKLLPIECWRLQGFKDSQFLKAQNAGISRAQLYKQAGNAVTTNVIEVLGRFIQAIDKEEFKTMPNHVMNMLTFSGDAKRISEMKEKIKNDEYGLGTIDFEKIIPMPDSIYRGDLGKAEMEKYGKNNWYDWRVGHWGTKWPAYGFDETVDYSQNNTIEFQTAWAAPHPVIEQLAKMYPDITITHKWADEDLGMNCGEYEYADGERIREYYPEVSKERLDFALDMWGLDPAELGLAVNGYGNDYVQLRGESFELIEVEGQKALFANHRMTKADIPQGLYVYHLREGDNGEFSTIEPQVLVNHAGSVVTKKPIDFKGADHIDFDEDSSPNFLGEEATFEDLIEMSDQAEDMEVIQ